MCVHELRVRFQSAADRLHRAGLSIIGEASRQREQRTRLGWGARKHLDDRLLRIRAVVLVEEELRLEDAWLEIGGIPLDRLVERLQGILEQRGIVLAEVAAGDADRGELARREARLTLVVDVYEMVELAHRSRAFAAHPVDLAKPDARGEAVGRRSTDRGGERALGSIESATRQQRFAERGLLRARRALLRGERSPHRSRRRNRDRDCERPTSRRQANPSQHCSMPAHGVPPVSCSIFWFVVARSSRSFSSAPS